MNNLEPVAETQTPSTESGASPRRGVIRRMYDWVLGWADSRFGTLALFLISFAESSFFPIPPDVLQVALSVARPRRSFFYAGVNAVGSVLGAIVGYYVGYAFWSVLGEFFYSYVPGVNEESVQHVGKLYQDNAFLSIFGAAFTPIPFKVFTIAAGVFSDYVSLQTLLVAAALGRSCRFLMVATAIFFFGERVRHLLEKHLEVMTLVLFVLVVLGFVVVKFVLH